MSKCGGVHCPGCGDTSAGTVLLSIGAVLLLGSGGAVAAVSAAVIDALLAAFIVTALTVAAGAAWVVYRALHPAVVALNPSREGFVRTQLVRSTVVREMPGARPAIGPRPATAGEFEAAYAASANITVDVLHYYGLHGVPCDCGAPDCKGWVMSRTEILRRSQRPE